MECCNKTCCNTAVVTIPYLDTDGLIHDMSVCNDCKKLPCFSDFEDEK